MSTLPENLDTIKVPMWSRNPDLPNLHGPRCPFARGITRFETGCGCESPHLNVREEEEMTVSEIVYFADNSIEARGYLTNGKWWSVMVVAPSGDACF